MNFTVNQMENYTLSRYNANERYRQTFNHPTEEWSLESLEKLDLQPEPKLFVDSPVLVSPKKKF